MDERRRDAWLQGVMAPHVARILRTYFLAAGIKTDKEAARIMRLRGVSVSRQHMQRLGRGDRRVTPYMCNQLAHMLKLSDEDRHRLARAAAKDYGYDIGHIEGGPAVPDE